MHIDLGSGVVLALVCCCLPDVFVVFAMIPACFVLGLVWYSAVGFCRFGCLWAGAA